MTTPTEQQQTEPGRERDGSESYAAGVIMATVPKLTITAKGLDPITAILEDYGEGRGKLMLECFGDAWSYYWGAMGPHTLRQFILSASDAYLASKLCRQPERVIDWDEISDKVGQSIRSEVDAIENDTLLAEHYGADWRMDLPQTMSRDWLYVRDIVAALKAALAQNAGDA